MVLVSLGFLAPEASSVGSGPRLDGSWRRVAHLGPSGTADAADLFARHNFPHELDRLGLLLDRKPSSLPRGHGRLLLQGSPASVRVHESGGGSVLLGPKS